MEADNRMLPSISLPNEVLEEIFLRLPVKTLIRFKSLSKKWKSTIESQFFVKRHLKIAELDHSKLMVVNKECPSHSMGHHQDQVMCFRTLCVESSFILSCNHINFPRMSGKCVSQSCDGLFCIYSLISKSMYVVNPATRWVRELPQSRFQILMHKFVLITAMGKLIRSFFDLAFVKAADYKLVWLCNSNRYNHDPTSPNQGVTKCDVFDFRKNAWRTLSCTPSYTICHNQRPAFANGSIYWFTSQHSSGIKVVAFDIHTETFRLLPNIIPDSDASEHAFINMSVLDNHLYMSKRERNTTIQDIWKLNQEDIWEKIFTIDLLSCSSFKFKFGDEFDWRNKDVVEACTPVAVCKNKKILLTHRPSGNLLKYDPLTKTLESIYQNRNSQKNLYFESLISHI